MENEIQPGMAAIIMENNAPAENTASPLQKVLAEKKFDAASRQTLSFRREGEAEEYLLEFAIGGLDDDEVLDQFDRLVVSKQGIEGDTIIVENDDLAACEWFFDNHIELVGGFEGELPSSWQAEFSPFEKQEIVRVFLFAQVLPDTRPKAVKAFTFGRAKSGKSIEIKAVYNGQEVLLKHRLPANFNSFAHKFREITRANEIKRGDDAFSSPSVWLKLGALYDEMKVTSDDYTDDLVPLHHKAIVMRDAFGANLQKQVKKQNG